MNNLYVGKITSPHGLKGDMKVFSDSNLLDSIFKVNNTIYIDNNKYILEYVSINKNIIIKLKDFDTIESINELINKEIYINKEECNINEYLYIELLNKDVYFNDKLIGKIDEILYNRKNTYFKINNNLIPYEEKYIKEINLDNNKIVLEGIGDYIL